MVVRRGWSASGSVKGEVVTGLHMINKGMMINFEIEILAIKSTVRENSILWKCMDYAKTQGHIYNSSFLSSR